MNIIIQEGIYDERVTNVKQFVVDMFANGETTIELAFARLLDHLAKKENISVASIGKIMNCAYEVREG